MLKGDYVEKWYVKLLTVTSIKAIKCILPLLFDSPSYIQCNLNIQDLRFSWWCCRGFRPSGMWCCVTGWVILHLSKDCRPVIFKGQTVQKCGLLKALQSFERSYISHPVTASHARRLEFSNLNIVLLGWTNDVRSTPKTGSRPICIVAKRVFPCEHAYYTSDGIADIDAHSHADQTVKMCASNYFYWDTEDCSITHSHPYICERPLDDVGELLVTVIIQAA